MVELGGEDNGDYQEGDGENDESGGDAVDGDGVLVRDWSTLRGCTTCGWMGWVEEHQRIPSMMRTRIMHQAMKITARMKRYQSKGFDWGWEQCSRRKCNLTLLSVGAAPVR